MDTFEKIKNIANDICGREGCKLYDLEFTSGSKGRGRKLLIYVDKSDGVSLEDCERVSKGVSEVLDAEELMPEGDYILEVSSPGLEKPLKEKWHFESAIGKKIFVQSKESIVPPNTENMKRFKVTGFLEVISEEMIAVKAEGKFFEIPLNHIKKAHVIFDYDSIKNDKTKSAEKALKN